MVMAVLVCVAHSPQSLTLHYRSRWWSGCDDAGAPTTRFIVSGRAFTLSAERAFSLPDLDEAQTASDATKPPISIYGACTPMKPPCARGAHEPTSCFFWPCVGPWGHLRVAPGIVARGSIGRRHAQEVVAPLLHIVRCARCTPGTVPFLHTVRCSAALHTLTAAEAHCQPQKA